MKNTAIGILSALIVCFLVFFWFDHHALKDRIANCQTLIYQANSTIYDFNISVMDAQHKNAGAQTVELRKEVDDLVGQNECFKGNEAVEMQSR